MSYFGNPVYNIEAEVNPPTKRDNLPLKLLEASIAVLEAAGLLGKHHVTEKGFYMPGHEPGFETKTGKFDMFYRRGMAENVIEHAEAWRKRNMILPGGNSEENQEYEDMSQLLAEILPKASPFSLLNFEDYGELPMIESMEIQTPVGRQGTHFHCNDGRILRLYYPASERFWFDYDQLRLYLLKKSIGLEKDVEAWRMLHPSENLRQKALSRAISWFSQAEKERRKVIKMANKSRKLMEMDSQLFLDPDSVNGIEALICTGH